MNSSPRNSRFLIALPLGALLGTTTLAAPAPKGADEWYMKTNLHVVDISSRQQWADTTSGVFGRLEASADGYDQHDIPAFSSALASPAALVFVHGTDWGEREGQYLSNYLSTRGQAASWPFIVVSTVENAEATLSWDGLFELTPYADGGLIRYAEEKTLDSRTLDNLTLVDMQTYQVIDALAPDGTFNSYTFSMGGETIRHFLWVLGPVNASHFEPGSQVMRYIQKKKRELADGPPTKATEAPANRGFGLPPD
jgi:hypothetical protein